jgi:shikimate dehydrogenase
MNFLSEITGCFASPCAENPTVAMIEAAYRHHGLDWRYLNCEVAPADLGDAVRGARAMRWAGFNCSLPHKVAVISHLDGLGQSAAIIGAVNCVVRREGKFIGENTDGKGFVQSLRQNIDPAGKSIVLFGAGGAARAIGVETALAGAKKITVVNRSSDRGQTLAQLLNEKTPAKAQFVLWDVLSEGGFSIPDDTDIVVNSTSIGLFPDVDARLPIRIDTLLPRMLVADVIPNPPQTRLMRDAQSRGCTAIDGLGMLVNQGVIGIKYWTGVDVDPAVMRTKLEQIFHGSAG